MQGITFDMNCLGRFAGAPKQKTLISRIDLYDSSYVSGGQGKLAIRRGAGVSKRNCTAQTSIGVVTGVQTDKGMCCDFSNAECDVVQCNVMMWCAVIASTSPCVSLNWRLGSVINSDIFVRKYAFSKSLGLTSCCYLQQFGCP